MSQTQPPPQSSALPPADHTQGHSAISNGRMALLFMVMLVAAAGNTAMHSVMPSVGTALKIDDVWISLAYSWSALLWVACAPIWARRSDKRGRKAMMALGLIGFIASMSLCAAVLWAGLSGWLAGTWTLILFAIARSAYGGFGSAAPPAVQAYVAARTPRSERTKALSLVASSFGLGTVVGPVLAPLMIVPFFGIGLTGPFWFFTLVGIIVLILVRLRLPNDEPQFAARGKTFGDPGAGVNDSDAMNERDKDDQEDDEEESDPALPQGDQARLKWFEPRLRHWVIASLFGGHAQAMIMGIVGFLVLDRLDLRDNLTEGTSLVSLVLVFGALATLLAQWGIIPRFQIGPRAATLWGLVVAAFGTAILGVADTVLTLSLGFAIASLGFGLFRPGTTAGTSLAVTRAEQGQASGIVASVAGASFIYAPGLGVWLYSINDWLGFGAIIAVCLGVALVSWLNLARDEVLTTDR
ncbi:multidrug transporter [Erythrobacter longus]|uniref:Multidrug transporter n=1 Tax=Erythrobacter longus TaxID=1044 RepID=A0A074MEC3_ERYLO|nr:multidrug transporter [Erythrobacter longus]